MRQSGSAHSRCTRCTRCTRALALALQLPTLRLHRASPAPPSPKPDRHHRSLISCIDHCARSARSRSASLCSTAPGLDGSTLLLLSICVSLLAASCHSALSHRKVEKQRASEECAEECAYLSWPLQCTALLRSASKAHAACTGALHDVCLW